MANPFLNVNPRDTETAIMLEKAIVHDIGNAVAYTDGDKVFLNTDDNLFNILPAYDPILMKKWLLWHERFHMELRHHNRFFKYLNEIDEAEAEDKFHLTKSEVNIIMDILVHDSLSKMFPELVTIAKLNLAQMRNSNSLGYTFTTFTLEEMLDEYSKHKNPEKDGDGEDSTDGTDETSKDKTEETDTPKKKKESKKKDEDKKDKDKKDEDEKEKGHSTGKDKGESKEETKEKKTPIKTETPEPLPDEHDKTDWKQLDKIDDQEFIDKAESERIMNSVNKLKRKKFKLAKITETLNSLVTSSRKRTYAKPNPIRLSGGAVLKGSTPGRTQLYLCFDASGSMGGELVLFKDIISKSIPQAMETPTEWFSGYGERISRNPDGRNSDYFKGKFKDIIPVKADSGYSDDGDRTIELCWKAEQMGYSPIGITDGGGRISWSKDKLKQLKRTVFIGHDEEWLKAVKEINPRVQILDV